MKIINLTHVSLDGIASNIIISEFHKSLSNERLNITVELIPIGYARIDKSLDDIMERIENKEINDGDGIIISCLSLSLPQIAKIAKFQDKNKIRVQVVTNQKITELDKSKLKTLKTLKIDFIKGSTSLYLFNEYKKIKRFDKALKLPKNEKIEEFIDSVDAFSKPFNNLDDSKLFKKGQYYNDLLWCSNPLAFKKMFVNGYSFKKLESRRITQLMKNIKEKDELFSSLEEHNSILKVKGDETYPNLLIANIDSHFGHLRTSYPNYDIYLVTSSWGGFSFVFKDEKIRERFEAIYKILQSTKSIKNLKNDWIISGNLPTKSIKNFPKSCFSLIRNISERDKN